MGQFNRVTSTNRCRRRHLLSLAKHPSNRLWLRVHPIPMFRQHRQYRLQTRTRQRRCRHRLQELRSRAEESNRQRRLLDRFHLTEGMQKPVCSSTNKIHPLNARVIL